MKTQCPSRTSHNTTRWRRHWSPCSQRSLFVGSSFPHLSVSSESRDLSTHPENIQLWPLFFFRAFSLQMFKTLPTVAFYDFYSRGDLFGCARLAEIRDYWHDSDWLWPYHLECDHFLHLHDIPRPAYQVQPCCYPAHSRPAWEHNEFLESLKTIYLILTTAYRRVKFGDDKYSVNTTRTVFKIDSFTATLYIFGRVPLSFIVHFYLVKMKVPRAIGADA